MHSQKCYRVENCQFYRLVTACQQVSTNLSISSSCSKSVKIRLVATCHLQTCYNLLKQLAASKWITSFDNQLATINSADKLQQTFRHKLWQAMRTHPHIGLLITSSLQHVNRLVRTCAFLVVYTSKKILC